MGQKAKHVAKLVKSIKAPVRLLVKARDFYVNSLSEFSGTAMFAPPAPARYIAYLPKTKTLAPNTDEDLRELIRVASQRDLNEKLEKEIQQQKLSSKRLPRSFTVGVQRIDEDEVCEFPELPNLMKVDALYPTSRSHAVSSKRTDLYSS